MLKISTLIVVQLISTLAMALNGEHHFPDWSLEKTLQLPQVQKNLLMSDWKNIPEAIDSDIHSRSNDKIAAILFQNKNKMVVVGSSIDSDNKSSLILTRLQTNGDIDKNYGVDGTVKSIFSKSAGALSAQVQWDQKVIVAGYVLRDFEECCRSTRRDMLVSRYNVDGSIDTSFGNSGKIIISFGNAWATATTIQIRSDHKIIVAGSIYYGNAKLNIVLMQLNEDGTFDNSFGEEGIAVTNLGLSDFDEINSMQLQADGKITLAGEIDSDMAVLRFLKSGELDSSFAVEGKWTPKFNGCHAMAKAHSIQTNGDIYVVGTQKCGDNWTEPYGVIYRIDSTGTQDMNFGSDGFVTSKIWRSFSDLQIQPDGKIIVVGSAFSRITVARYSPKGRLDYFGFGYNGVFEDHSSDIEQRGVALLVRNDGEIIIGAESYSRFRDFDFGVTALSSLGGINSNFGVDGRVYLDFGQNSDSK
jgi:uncharacterized delta-60 repeat protein